MTGHSENIVSLQALLSWRSGLRLVVFSTLWAVLTAGEPASWVIGLPAVLAAIVLTTALEPANISLPSLPGLLTFGPWFIKASVLAGVDVARRAFAPSPRLDPAVVYYQPRLPPGAPRIFFANCISLLPGTLTADWDGDGLSIHVLDAKLDNYADLQRLEAHVARLFGLQLPDAGGDNA